MSGTSRHGQAASQTDRKPGEGDAPAAASVPSRAAANLRGIVAICASMAGFVGCDTCMKLASAALPAGEILFFRNGIATVLIALVLLARAERFALAGLPRRLLALRALGEMAGTLFFLSALVRIPIADANGIVQVMPLTVTAAAAIFLGERVGWRRWLAALAGFAGVLLIIRPGTSAFTPAALLAVGSVIFFTLRDIATRQIAVGVPTLYLTLISSVTVWCASLVLLPFESWRWPSSGQLVLLTGAALFLLAGYIGIIVAMRTGDMGAITPFRYTLVLWAILSGYLVWGEVPDREAVAGLAIVVGAGLYTLHREQIRRREAVEAARHSRTSD